MAMQKKGASKSPQANSAKARTRTTKTTKASPKKQEVELVEEKDTSSEVAASENVEVVVAKKEEVTAKENMPAYESPCHKMNKALNDIIEASETDEEAVLMDNGKRYLTVNQRIKYVRKAFGFDIKIISLIKEVNPQYAHVEAQIWIKQEGDWELIQTANAMEEKHISHINSKNYVEVAETSAIGRGLAFLGLSAGELASAEDMQNALSNGTNTNAKKPRSGVIKTQSKKTVTKETITEQQIKLISGFLKEQKTYTLADILANKNGADGKSVTKLEELLKTDAQEIVKLIEAQRNDSPL